LISLIILFEALFPFLLAVQYGHATRDDMAMPASPTHFADTHLSSSFSVWQIRFFAIEIAIPYVNKIEYMLVSNKSGGASLHADVPKMNGRRHFAMTAGKDVAHGRYGN